MHMPITHPHFEAVHPFRNGNSRVGRLLLPLMMAAEAHVPLYLSAYIEGHKHDCLGALTAVQQRLDCPTTVYIMADAIIGISNELMTARKALAEHDAD